MKVSCWKVCYPVLLGTYAAIGLLAVNISQMVLVDGMRTVLFAFLVSAIVYAVFCLSLKNTHKAALLATWFLIFFFAYGHVYGALEGVKIGGIVLGRHRYIFPLWVVLFAAGTWLIARFGNYLERLSRIMNYASIVLLLIPIAKVGIFEYHRQGILAGRETGATPATIQTIQPTQESQLPDIYYIILDGYPRQDALLKYHQFDNSDFIQQLEGLDFTIPRCTQSNYSMTNLSLGTSLNMNYLAQLSPSLKDLDLNGRIMHSDVRQFLENRGYSSVSFDSGIWFTQFFDARYHVSQQKPISSTFLDFTHLSEFEVLFIRTTVLRLAEESKSLWMGSMLENPRKEAYDRILFEFDQLAQTPPLPSPKFVFVHILAPHNPPFIFDSQGGFIVSYSVDPELGNELLYLNKRTLEAVQAILEGSRVPPVIIIQGDHGLDTEVRNAILNAYYLPGPGAGKVYPTITPVNSFRLVLNTYFGQDYPLLPDVSYYSSYEEMYNFKEVQYPCGE
jgi:hypothetical protein